MVAVLTVCGAGYLRIPLLHDVPHHAAIYQTEHIPKGGQQRVLSSSPSTHHQLPTFKAGQYNLRKQDNTTCATYGESQWTGTIDVTDTHRLFFWFFESRNDPVDDPIVIWINGGPGASSMLGLFNEIGPCSYESDANETTPNPWAWNRNASLLFIDQPAGVGFSSVAEGGRLPATDIDGAEDFQVFLNIFFQKVFPDKAHLPIYFTGESYGGHYAPVYTKHILESRAYNSKTAFWGNITSLVLVNALLDFTAPAIGVYELLCHQSRGQGILNVTACDGIRQNLPETERLGRVCDLSYDGHECLAMMTYFMNNINNYYYELVQSGERSPYNSKYSLSSLLTLHKTDEGRQFTLAVQIHSSAMIREKGTSPSISTGRPLKNLWGSHHHLHTVRSSSNSTWGIGETGCCISLLRKSLGMF